MDKYLIYKNNIQEKYFNNKCQIVYMDLAFHQHFKD